MSLKKERIHIVYSNTNKSKSNREDEKKEEKITLSEEPAKKIYSNPEEKINSSILFEEYLSKIYMPCKLEEELYSLDQNTFINLKTK